MSVVQVASGPNRPLIKSRSMTVHHSLLLSLLLITLALSACDFGSGSQVQVAYKPPFAPVIFSLDNNGIVSVMGDASITTPIGDFSVDAGGFVSPLEATPTLEKLTLIIRHSKNGQAVDSVYSLATSDEEVSITTDGLTQITVTSHQVFIDATKSKIKSITLKDIKPLTYSLGDPDTNFGSSLAWSPDGKLIAVSDVNNIQIFNAHDASQVLTLSGDTSDTFVPTHIAWSPDGKYIASTSDDHQIYIFNAKTGNKVQNYNDLFAKDGVLYSLAWSPDSKYIAETDLVDGTNVIEALTGKRITAHAGYAESSPCTWSPDGKYIITTSSDGTTTQIWNALTGQNMYTFSGKGLSCFSPNGKLIASEVEIGPMHIWDAFTGNNDHSFTEHGFQFVWSPDSTRIMSTKDPSLMKQSPDPPSVEIWNTQTGSTIVTYRYPHKTFQSSDKTYAYGVSDAQWSPNGNQVAIIFRNEVTIQNSSSQ